MPAEGLAKNFRVERAIGKMLFAFDDRVLQGRIDPNVRTLCQCQSLGRRALCLGLDRGQTHPGADAAVALDDSLRIHRDVPLLQGLVNLDSQGHCATMA